MPFPGTMNTDRELSFYAFRVVRPDCFRCGWITCTVAITREMLSEEGAAKTSTCPYWEKIFLEIV